LKNISKQWDFNLYSAQGQFKNAANLEISQVLNSWY